MADEHLSPLGHTIAMTGMRRGEAIGLRWSDVDLENARLAVRRALIPINREVVVSEPKTAKGRRVIALDPGTVEVLKAQAARQLDEQKDWDEAWIETGLVFTQENGAALDPESVSRYWRQAVKKAMLPTIRLHDLRHTHATLALQAGIHPKVVSERLGHANISITLDTCSHAIPAMQEEAATLIAGLVFASWRDSHQMDPSVRRVARGRGAGATQPTSRRRNPLKPTTMSTVATPLSHSSGATVSAPPGILGTWMKGEIAITMWFSLKSGPNSPRSTNATSATQPIAIHFGARPNAATTTPVSTHAAGRCTSAPPSTRPTWPMSPVCAA